MKKLFAAVVLPLCAVVCVQAQSLSGVRHHCAADTARLEGLLAEGLRCGLTSTGDLVNFYARRLLGTPYVAHTLEGDEELLTINVDELDCTTFVETLYALTRSTLDRSSSWHTVAQYLQNLRYRDGRRGDYSTRLHYFSDMLADNIRRGNLVEVTADLPYSTTVRTTLNYMTTHPQSYHSLKNDPAMVEYIRSFEKPYTDYRQPCLPKGRLKNASVKRMLRTGDFVGLVTRNAGLDVSHLGILVKDKHGEVYLLDASMIGGKVMLEKIPLWRQLARSKSNVGIRVYRMAQ